MRPISAWQAIARHIDDPDFPRLEPLDWALLEADPEFALRPDQRVEHSGCRYMGYLGGRGLGKSYAIAKQINDKVGRGEISHLALMAQNEDKSQEIQVEPLLQLSTPWNRARRLLGGVVWDNGAHATIYTPESPGNPRGFNGDAAWLSELVAWPAPTREEAFSNLLTAIRLGAALIWWDTTSKGRNELIAYMMSLHTEDPVKYPIVRGEIFDNPLFGRDYLREQCRLYSGRRYEEELLGRVFDEADGALFKQDDISTNRIFEDLPKYDLTIIGLDPGVSTKDGVDGTGLIVASRKDHQYYVRKDASGILTPEQYATIVIDECEAGASGVVIETNKGGANTTSVIRAMAQLRKRPLQIRMLKDKDRFPQRTPGVIYVREVFSRNDKLTRAEGPSVLYSKGQVHHVGLFPELENEQCTYDGSGKSPNRYDACNEVLTELAELKFERSHATTSARMVDESRVADELRARLRSLGRGRLVV